MYPPKQLATTFLLIFAATIWPALAQDSEITQVQNDVKIMGRAAYENDPDLLLKYTHPAVIKALGGPGAARDALSQALEQVASLGMQQEKLTFPEPPTFLEGGERRFVIVPTLTLISAGSQRVESLNFQVGMKLKGATGWSYIEGSRLTPENIPHLLPGFPADYKLPEFYRKELQP